MSSDNNPSAQLTDEAIFGIASVMMGFLHSGDAQTAREIAIQLKAEIDRRNEDAQHPTVKFREPLAQAVTILKYVKFQPVIARLLD